MSDARTVGPQSSSLSHRGLGTALPSVHLFLRPGRTPEAVLSSGSPHSGSRAQQGRCPRGRQFWADQSPGNPPLRAVLEGTGAHGLSASEGTHGPCITSVACCALKAGPSSLASWRHLRQTIRPSPSSPWSGPEWNSHHSERAEGRFYWDSSQCSSLQEDFPEGAGDRRTEQEDDESHSIADCSAVLMLAKPQNPVWEATRHPEHLFPREGILLQEATWVMYFT